MLDSDYGQGNMLRVVREGRPAQQKGASGGDKQRRLPGRGARKGLETQDGKDQGCLLPPFTLNKETKCFLFLIPTPGRWILCKSKDINFILNVITDHSEESPHISLS